MKRWNLLNTIIEKNGYTEYLEIGIRPKGNISRIKCENIDGVDPNKPAKYHMTSDEFFEQIPNTKKYDIIFIDGLHIYEQVIRDIHNSLNYLRENGTIVMHDCNPKTRKHQAVPRESKAWNGTVWKAFVELRCTNKNLTMCVVDMDHGCGIIRRGSQDVYEKAPLKKCLTWEYFKNHKRELLNLISIDEFFK